MVEEFEDLKDMDWGRLHLFTDGDPVETQELIELFTSNAEESIKILHQRCANENDEEWKAAAHKIKGSAANLGADKLAAFCKAAGSGWQEELAAKERLVRKIEENYAALVTLLQDPVLEIKSEDW